mgnify:CR=1 FL=1
MVAPKVKQNVKFSALTVYILIRVKEIYKDSKNPKNTLLSAAELNCVLFVILSIGI